MSSPDLMARCGLLLLTATSWSSSAADAATATPPNIVFILGDDVGFGDVGYASPDVISPTIDALAAEGVKLGRHYTYMWCAPSRSALLSGRFPPNTGVYGGASGSLYAMQPDIVLLPELLRTHANYSTAMVRVE